MVERILYKYSYTIGAFMPKPKIHPRTYNCIQCKAEVGWTLQKQNKFCSHNCQQQHKWENKTKQLIEEGLVTTNSLKSLYRYVTERDGYRCSCCGIENWMGEKISLDLDHIDGNNKNNFPNNLRFLCPNCHRQTPTWGNKHRSLD